jgi:acetyl-CoA carboxylase biotin carboxyl carrier protein
MTAVENGARSHLAPQAAQAPQTAPEDPPNSAQPQQEAVLGLCDAAAHLARNLPAPLHRLSLRAGDCAVDLEFSLAEPAPESRSGMSSLASGMVSMVGRAASGPANFGPVAGSTPGDETGIAGTIVPAPLVGTFYAAQSPGAEPFVRVGDQVDVGQTVGIVEAMKLMNPVVTEVAGTVAQILVADAAPVEHDQPLIVIVPGQV